MFVIGLTLLFKPKWKEQNNMFINQSKFISNFRTKRKGLIII